MKVIVTGGSGRIGKAVIQTLAARGHELINIDRRPADDRPAKFIYMDLRNRELLQPVMEQADTIIHMGEIPSAKGGHTTEEAVFGSNCTVGSLIFQLATELKYKRVLYTSTIQVYGISDVGAIPPAVLPMDENHPLLPQNGYALAKVANESYARFCGSKRGLSIGVFRLPWVLSHEINEQWFNWTEREKKIGNDLDVYVKDTDVAECFALALEKPMSGFEAYNLSAKEVLFGFDLREAIARDLPNHPKLPEGWGKSKTPYLWDKAKAHFGWEPKWNYLDVFRQKFGRDPEMKD